MPPYGSKCQFENGASAPKFEPANKNSNSRGFLQSAQPYGSKCQFEHGRRAPQFEPFAKNGTINSEKGEVGTEIDKTISENEELKPEGREELNTNIESKSKTKNKQTAKTTTKSKTTLQTIQKFSNHIKFIDYIPTHELITYRHLFAYGFYVE